MDQYDREQTEKRIERNLQNRSSVPQTLGKWLLACTNIDMQSANWLTANVICTTERLINSWSVTDFFPSLSLSIGCNVVMMTRVWPVQYITAIPALPIRMDNNDQPDKGNYIFNVIFFLILLLLNATDVLDTFLRRRTVINLDRFSYSSPGGIIWLYTLRVCDYIFSIMPIGRPSPCPISIFVISKSVRSGSSHGQYIFVSSLSVSWFHHRIMLKMARACLKLASFLTDLWYR